MAKKATFYICFVAFILALIAFIGITSFGGIAIKAWIVKSIFGI